MIHWAFLIAAFLAGFALGGLYALVRAIVRAYGAVKDAAEEATTIGFGGGR